MLCLLRGHSLCQQAAYRTRQRTSADQRNSSGGQHTERQDWRSESQQQRRPPPHSANGHRPGAGSGDDLARIRRFITTLLRKAAATSFPHEAAACREKARPCGPSTACSR